MLLTLMYACSNRGSPSGLHQYIRPMNITRSEEMQVSFLTCQVKKQMRSTIAFYRGESHRRFGNRLYSSGNWTLSPFS